VVRQLDGRHELVLADLIDAPASAHRFIRGDLEDPEVCRQAVDGVEAVIHLAAKLAPHIPRCYETNTLTTWNVCQAAVKAGIRRIVFASTINTYGQGHYKIGKKVRHPPYLPIDERVPVFPEDGYGLSKVANEELLRGVSDAYGISTYAFRLPWVASPERVAGYVPREIEPKWALSPMRVIDPWNYIDVRDAAAAFRLAVESPSPPAHGVSYLTADDTLRPEPTMELLAKYIPEWVPLAGDRLPGHTPWFSSASAKADFGWKPVHTWRKQA